MTARHSQHAAFLPLRHLLSTQTNQARGFRLYVVSLDVQVDTRCVTDRLDCHDQPRQGLMECGELRCRRKRSGSSTESCCPEVRCLRSLGEHQRTHLPLAATPSAARRGSGAATAEAQYGSAPRSPAAGPCPTSKIPGQIRFQPARACGRSDAYAGQGNSAARRAPARESTTGSPRTPPRRRSRYCRRRR